MKLRKIFIPMTAAALALSMTINASAATYLFDKCYPASVEENKEANDAYYSIGAMGFFMSQQWKWNQGDWVAIDEDGVIDIKYEIGAPMADTTLSGKGTLGDMGVMICNLPSDGYPYNIEITDCKFVAEDGTVTEFPKINATTIAKEDAESGYRIHIRPTDEVNEETGEVTKTARPEVAGWDQEGAFNGGTLSMKINFNVKTIDVEEDGTEPVNAAASTEEKTEETKEETKEETTEQGGGTQTENNENASGGVQQEGNAQTGAASNTILAGMALAAAGIIASKKRK